MKLRDIKRRSKTHYQVMEGIKFVRHSRAKRCKTYEAGCTNCDWWRFYDENSRFVYDFHELKNFMDITEKESEA
jgi:hypothetical protein